MKQGMIYHPTECAFEFGGPSVDAPGLVAKFKLKKVAGVSFYIFVYHLNVSLGIGAPPFVPMIITYYLVFVEFTSCY